jgi:hypothetical protein
MGVDLNISFFKSAKLWKDSAILGLAIIGVVASIVGIAGISFADSFSTWAVRLSVTIATYILMVIIIAIMKLFRAKTGITVNVNGISVHIKQGDLFGVDGWKVIPFNEYFDTTVDDKIISHSSLNGIFINEYVSDVQQLKQAIEQDDESITSAKRSIRDNRFVYPLGRVIIYQEYMLLALTHFNNQNMAYVSKVQYEQCLMTMWHEISRTYAGKSIFLPLLGSGITRFDDVPNKSHIDLLKCMLCTLKSSGENISKPITILLTSEIMQSINIYEMKGAI